MKEPGLEDRHRVLLTRISRKDGDTLVSTLRLNHGPDLLPKFAPTDNLSTVLQSLDMASLNELEAKYPDDELD